MFAMLILQINQLIGKTNWDGGVFNTVFLYFNGFFKKEA